MNVVRYNVKRDVFFMVRWHVIAYNFDVMQITFFWVKLRNYNLSIKIKTLEPR